MVNFRFVYGVNLTMQSRFKKKALVSIGYSRFHWLFLLVPRFHEGFSI
jgi:hypothetical protein